MKSKKAREVLQARFEGLQGDGAKEFGPAWIEVNQAAINGATYLGFDKATAEVRALLTEVCFRVLMLQKVKQLDLKEDWQFQQDAGIATTA